MGFMRPFQCPSNECILFLCDDTWSELLVFKKRRNLIPSLGLLLLMELTSLSGRCSTIDRALAYHVWSPGCSPQHCMKLDTCDYSTQQGEMGCQKLNVIFVYIECMMCVHVRYHMALLPSIFCYYTSEFFCLFF